MLIVQKMKFTSSPVRHVNCTAKIARSHSLCSGHTCPLCVFRLTSVCDTIKNDALQFSQCVFVFITTGFTSLSTLHEYFDLCSNTPHLLCLFSAQLLAKTVHHLAFRSAPETQHERTSTTRLLTPPASANYRSDDLPAPLPPLPPLRRAEPPPPRATEPPTRRAAVADAFLAAGGVDALWHYYGRPSHINDLA